MKKILLVFGLVIGMLISSAQDIDTLKVRNEVDMFKKASEYIELVETNSKQCWIIKDVAWEVMTNNQRKGMIYYFKEYAILHKKEFGCLYRENGEVLAKLNSNDLILFINKQN